MSGNGDIVVKEGYNNREIHRAIDKYSRGHRVKGPHADLILCESITRPTFEIKVRRRSFFYFIITIIVVVVLDMFSLILRRSRRKKIPFPEENSKTPKTI